MESVADSGELEEMLSAPTPGVVRALGELPGDIVVLGAGGKMGPSLARMAKRASDAAGVQRNMPEPIENMSPAGSISGSVSSSHR